MCTARLLFCGAWSLSFVSVTGAAFERALFPQPLLDTISRVTTNPASLANVHHPCGGVGHDRPFGLQALSGHRVLLDVPLPRGVAMKLDGARRGPQRHREYAAWLGLGTRVFVSLAVGVAAQRLAWRGAARARSAGVSLAAGWLLELPGPWSLEGLVRPATGIAPARGWLRLRRSDLSGAAPASLSVRAGRPTIPSLSMAARLNRRLSLSGQVRSLARDFRGSATLSSAPLALQVDVVTHPVLGSSPGGWVGRTYR